MKLTVKRKWPREGYTIGELYVDGVKLCNTLEDTDRGLLSGMTEDEIAARKIYGKTAVPRGTYPLQLAYSPKFAKRSWCAQYGGKLPILRNVPGYSGVLIHVGNSAEDTSGCVLVGRNTVKGGLTSSTRTFYDLMDHYLLPAFKRGEEVKITIE